MCNDCPKRDNCKQICKELESVLEGLNHSIKSDYLVTFVDPFILEATATVLSNEERSPTEARWETYRRLDRKLGRLSKIQRICICYYYGLRGESSISQYAIAKILNRDQKTVWYHLDKARKLLRQRMPKIV